jgi:nicotinate phosphoribosyltransferase
MSSKPPVSLWPDPQALGALTDLYQLTMMAGYHAAGKAGQKATFELFVRKMPPGRAFLVFAGLEQAVGDLLALAFDPDQFAEIREWPAFRGIAPEVMDRVASTRFEGDVYAVPEGTVVFPGEPLLRVVAPLPQAQWVETHLLASIAYPTLVASKAARVVAAAAGRSLFEFGARRGHGPLAGLLAARSAMIAGFDGTSHVEAARRLGVPALGTMAHSWVQSFPTEADAFATFARIFPGNTTLLVDTYNTPEGVRLAASIEPPVQAIRLDSGDLGALAKEARAILDHHGRSSVKIVASSDLDEYRIAELLGSGAPIDAFGVGTELITCRDSPALSLVYKLVELDGQGRSKLSPGKTTYPMAKQIFRRRDRSNRFCGDHVVRAGDSAEGEPLLVPILQAGRQVHPLPSLEGIRSHCRQQLASLPEHLRALDATPNYPITYGKF